MADTTTGICIGPADHGRRMSFADLRDAEGTPGHLYELAKGVVAAVDIPGGSHAEVVDVLHQRLAEPGFELSLADVFRPLEGERG